jgi:hypothetical protein
VPPCHRPYRQCATDPWNEQANHAGDRLPRHLRANLGILAPGRVVPEQVCDLVPDQTRPRRLIRPQRLQHAKRDSHNGASIGVAGGKSVRIQNVDDLYAVGVQVCGPLDLAYRLRHGAQDSRGIVARVECRPALKRTVGFTPAHWSIFQ